MGVFDTLFDDAVFDDAAMVSPAGVSVDEAVAAHRDRRLGRRARSLGPLVVPDDRLAHVGRVGGDESIEVCVVASGGAGGVLALARRDLRGVAVVAVESALRDLDDLAGNAARVAAAAEGLGESIRVFVEIPHAPGWIGAVERVEAAGLLGAIRTSGDPVDHRGADTLAEQMSGLVEADLPFKLTGGIRRAWPSGGAHGYLTVLLALEALIDGADATDAAELLQLRDRERIATGLSLWDEATAARVRRRLRSVHCDDVRAAFADLDTMELP